MKKMKNMSIALGLLLMSTLHVIAVDIEIIGAKNPRDRELLLSAAKEGDVGAIQKIRYDNILDKVNPEDVALAVRYAAENNHKDAVHYLLILAADTGNLNAVKLALEHGARANIDEAFTFDPSFTPTNNALQSAAKSGHADVVEYLINQGANMNQGWKDDELNLSMSVLEFAISGAHSNVVKILLEKGYVVNDKDLIYASKELKRFQGILDSKQYFEGPQYTKKRINELQKIVKLLTEALSKKKNVKNIA